ncbi:hypothetical protein [Paracoccus sp. Ld10]|uniref:hypothetical protein n=1 Tax=Paracoccus sp. Ld10 TaxID=649158 RepID=UPI003870756E
MTRCTAWTVPRFPTRSGFTAPRYGDADSPTAMPGAKRRGGILIDRLRNERGTMAAALLFVRAVSGTSGGMRENGQAEAFSTSRGPERGWGTTTQAPGVGATKALGTAPTDWRTILGAVAYAPDGYGITQSATFVTMPCPRRLASADI